MFESGSRYAQVRDLVYDDGRGRQIPYKALRPIPASAALRVHTVVDADRLDLIADAYYDDPEQFWRVCDANRALWPDDLLEIGRRLAIPPALR